MPDVMPVLNELPARSFADLGLATFDQLPENERWIPLVPIGTWDHPEYGKLEITAATIAQMHGNHQAGLPGIDLPLDIEHNWGEAAGWLVRTEPRADALWGLVRLNDFGMGLVRDQRYRYISPEWYPSWKDPKTGQYYENVLTSVALTNRPFFKNLPALVASDHDGKRVLIAYQFVWEEKGNHIYHRLRDPDDFRKETFRWKDMPGAKGVAMILGKLKPDKVPEGRDADSMVVQALRFSIPDGWTMEKAKDWMAKHPDIRKAAEAADDDTLRRFAADTGDNAMPDEKTKTDTSDHGADQDHGADSKKGADSTAGVVSMTEFNVVKARAEKAESDAAASARVAADATARLDKAELKARVAAMRFGDDKRRAYAPAIVDQLTDIALKFAAGDDRDAFLKSIENGVQTVELGERGSGDVPAAGDPDAQIEQAVRAKMSATQGMTYSEALTAVQREQPALFQARDAQRGVK